MSVTVWDGVPLKVWDIVAVPHESAGNGPSPGAGREWASTLAMTVGLAGLLYFLDPTAGRTDQVHVYVWIIGIGVNLAVVLALAAWGRTGPPGPAMVTSLPGPMRCSVAIGG